MQQQFMNSNNRRKSTHRRVQTDICQNSQTHHFGQQLSKSHAKTNIHFQYGLKNNFSVLTNRDHQTTRSKGKPMGPVQEFAYNKWFIKPSIRLKKSFVVEMRPKEEDAEFVYNHLYAQQTLRLGMPFVLKRNEKLKILDQIPAHNIKLLEAFKKNQQVKRKRVPKIIDLFLKKKSGTHQNQDEPLPTLKFQ